MKQAMLLHWPYDLYDCEAHTVESLTQQHDREHWLWVVTAKSTDRKQDRGETT